MTASVHDVAAYILLQCRGGMSTMKLQKLCYYSQGWSLAWDERPLFDEQIQAWANGPVVYELFDAHRGRFSVSSWPNGDASRLDKDAVDTINAVLGAYGHLSGQQLSDLSHSEPPWTNARAGLPSGSYSSAEITPEMMQDFFAYLANEEAARRRCSDDFVEDEEVEAVLDDDSVERF